LSSPHFAIVSPHIVAPRKLFYRVPYGPGDNRQLKAQDVTAKLVRFDILFCLLPRRCNQKNILFCIKLMIFQRGRNEIWHTLHIRPNFHLTSHFQAHPRCLASSSPEAACAGGRCAVDVGGPIAQPAIVNCATRAVVRRRHDSALVVDVLGAPGADPRQVAVRRGFAVGGIDLRRSDDVSNCC